MRGRAGVRTVVDGRIRLNKRTWVPDECHQKYDGRLDGLRFLFMEYPHGQGPGLVALWGTEMAARGETAPEPECVEGYYPWYFWHLEE